MAFEKRGSIKSVLMPAERIMLTVTGGLVLATALLVVARGYAIDWLGYGTVLFFASVMMGLGLFYRIKERSPEIALTLIGTASFIYFTAVMPAFNYAMLPLWRAPIDPTLVAVDAMIGFHWPTAIALAGQSPLFVEITRYAYMSTLPQFALIVILLGLGGRSFELQRFMLATTLAAVATVGIWVVWPSFGTSTIYTLPADVAAVVNPLVGSDYGRELLRLGSEGPILISPKDAIGLIASPSFHTVMALLAIMGSRTLAYARWPLLGLNMLVLPGTVIHGGHHLVDLAMGGMVAVAGFALARHLLTREGAVPQLQPVSA